MRFLRKKYLHINGTVVHGPIFFINLLLLLLLLLKILVLCEFCFSMVGMYSVFGL